MLRPTLQNLALLLALLSSMALVACKNNKNKASIDSTSINVAKTLPSSTPTDVAKTLPSSTPTDVASQPAAEPNSNKPLVTQPLPATTIGATQDPKNQPLNVVITGNKTTGKTSLSLTWLPNPGPVDGYIVYNGPTPETANKKLTTTPQTSVTYDVAADLVLSANNQTCFRLRAFNADGISGFSEAACITINKP